MIIVFTGNGKGKTTAALGTALRALGYGKDVVLFSFIKKRKSGEHIFKSRKFKKFILGSGFTWVVGEEKSRKSAEEGWKFVNEYLKKKNPFIVILDEINYAIHYGFIDLKSVLEFLKKYKGRDDKIVILTGRYAKKEIIDIADIATEMVEIKHHFKFGKKAVKGIDF